MGGVMRKTAALCTTQIIKHCQVLFTLLVSVVSAHGQRYEVTPLVGGMFGGTVTLEEQRVPNFEAHVESSFSFGVAGGFRYDAEDCDGCNVIEFRWLRQNTHLALRQNPLLLPPVTAPLFRPAVTIDRFLGDFTREWIVKEARMIRPFVTASLGAARMSTPENNATRFMFGIGAGMKVFPKRHWGVRFQAEYLPIVMHANLQRVVCTVGCIVILSGGVMNQFELSVGPTFRF
jgi:hypothetical protein